ncbi:MAG: bifunctional precorrin-2 dehydrogenase/sirohydrochlorin ferrochelatase [Campylobacterales bacterium]|nr:bifunctional precorrin-2 dehydrogenase/sirohydrochlorin ferrochelatase [Campylobacterales bacterium]
MSYFPAFLQLEGKKILLVGGGNIALEKLEKLLDFTHNISLISLEFSPQILSLITQHNLKYKKAAYKEGDISEYAIVIVAVDDIKLQESIFYESKNYKCLCNAVDSTAYCDFIFPSYIKEGDLTVAISTSGASPAVAKRLKEYIKGVLPQNLNSFLQEMKALRSVFPKGKARMRFLDEKAKRYFSKNS